MYVYCTVPRPLRLLWFCDDTPYTHCMELAFVASVLSSVLFTIGMGRYVYDVYRGKIRVSIVTIFMLSLINFSQVGSLIAKELWYVVPFSVTAAVMNLVVCILGFRNGTFQFTKLDLAMFIGAASGLLAWYITNDPALNIYILTGVVLLSITPLILKVFKDPRSETKLPWAILLAASVVLQLTITSAQPVGWLVQIRQLLFAALVNAALYRKVK